MPTTHLPHPVPEALAEIIAGRFRALSDPTRIRLIDQLRNGEASVQELTATLGATQQNVSKHLAVLLGSGIVSRRREGTRALYTIADQTVLALCESVCGGIQRQLSELDQLLSGGAP